MIQFIWKLVEALSEYNEVFVKAFQEFRNLKIKYNMRYTRNGRLRKNYVSFQQALRSWFNLDV